MYIYLQRYTMLYYGTPNGTGESSSPKSKRLQTKQVYTRPNSYRKKILEGVKAKNLQVTIIFVNFSKAFDSELGKLAEILKAYGIPAETLEAIMMLYNDTKSLVRSPDGDTNFFKILAPLLSS